MMAYGACPGDADTPEIIQNLEALLKPHDGMIWELGPIGPEGEPLRRAFTSDEARSLRAHQSLSSAILSRATWTQR